MPSKTMDDIDFFPLSELKGFLTLDNIEKLKVEFIKEAVDNVGEQGLSIGPNNDSVTYFEHFIEDYTTVTFESYLQSRLDQYKDIIKHIDYALIKLSANLERFGYINNIQSEIRSIAKYQKVMFKKYKFLRTVIKDLIQHLVDKGYLKMENPFEKEEQKENIYVPPFKLKENLKKDKFHQLYQLFCKHGVIEKIDIEEEDFIKVFMGHETDKYIKFKAANRFSYNVLDSLTHIYKDFNATILEKSGRFYSKGNTPIRHSSYNSTLGKYPKYNTEDYENVLEGIKTIFN